MFGWRSIGVLAAVGIFGYACSGEVSQPLANEEIPLEPFLSSSGGGEDEFLIDGEVAGNANCSQHETGVETHVFTADGDSLVSEIIDYEIVNCETFDGGFVDIEVWFNGEHFDLPQISFDFDVWQNQENVGLPSGGTATLTATPADPHNCSFQGWRLWHADGTITTTDTNPVTHESGSGYERYTATFACDGNSDLLGEPNPEPEHS